jgi:hypothetical protein
MATKRQIAANRRNAKKCTGPKTAEGKAASSMNALRHGLRARTVVLPDENREEFDQIHAGLQNQYQPQNPSEQYLVDQAAIAQWKLVRAEVFEARFYAEEPSAKARNAMFGHLTLVAGRLERAWFKAYKELERIKAARQKQPPQTEESPQSETSQTSGRAPAVHLYWVNPETGERILAAQSDGGASHDLSQEEPRPPAPSPPA